MTNLYKLVQASKLLSSIFDFRLDHSRNKILSILIIIIRVILFVPIGIVVLLLQAFLYLNYLNMFFTSVPGTLVKRVRMDALGYDESNKWLFNLSYLLLYLFVLIFELAHIVIIYMTLILSFTIDCFMWVLTLGETKLNNTELSLTSKVNKSEKVRNIDIVTILFTLISIVVFIVFVDFFIVSTNDQMIAWVYSSLIVLALNVLFYKFFYKNRVKPNAKLKIENSSHAQ